MSRKAMQDAYDQKCEAIIAEHGWMIQGVFSTRDDNRGGFAYTVGLTAAGLPELVISGLPERTMGSLLNAAAKHTLDTELTAGDELTGIASVAFRIIDAPKAEVNMARHLYGPENVRALQLVWPDKNGLYPGDLWWSLGDVQTLYA